MWSYFWTSIISFGVGFVAAWVYRQAVIDELKSLADKAARGITGVR